MSIIYNENKEKLFQSNFSTTNEIPLERELENLGGTFIDISEGTPCMINVLKKGESNTLKNRNIIVSGKICSGKTTHMITMIRELLYMNPGLKIGVLEEYSEIKSAVPKVISVREPSEDLDVFVCTYDFHMISVAYNMNITVWCEIQGDEGTIEAVKKNLPCTKGFEWIQMSNFVREVLSNEH